MVGAIKDIEELDELLKEAKMNWFIGWGMFFGSFLTFHFIKNIDIFLLGVMFWLYFMIQYRYFLTKRNIIKYNMPLQSKKNREFYGQIK